MKCVAGKAPGTEAEPETAMLKSSKAVLSSVKVTFYPVLASTADAETFFLKPSKAPKILLNVSAPGAVSKIETLSNSARASPSGLLL